MKAAYPVEDYWSPSVAACAIQSGQRTCQDQTLRERLAADTKTYAYEFAENDGPSFTPIWRLGNSDHPFGATRVNDPGCPWNYLGTALPFSRRQERPACPNLTSPEKAAGQPPQTACKPDPLPSSPCRRFGANHPAFVPTKKPRHTTPYRRTRGIPRPIHEMISRWISLLPPPKVKITAER